jgi:hypothetical protein
LSVTNYDPEVAAILDRLVPPPVVEPSHWEELLHEARLGSPRVTGNRRRRRVLALVGAVVAAIVVAIPALAVREGWWFLFPGSPRPTSDVDVVTSGRWSGIDWKMTAYVSAEKGVCVAVTLDVGKPSMGGMSCGSGLRGEPFPHAEPWARHWVGYVYSSPGLYGAPDYVYGPVAEGVHSVDVVLSDGETLRASVIEAPEQLRVPLGFYAVPLPGHVPLASVRARDRFGTVLEERACTFCSDLPLASRAGRPR